MIAVSKHERLLRELPCVVSAYRPVTLHHCHGGSMLRIPWLKQPGMSQRANPFMQIPIAGKYHVGEFGVDTGMGSIKSVEQWEEAFGTQVEFLREVNGLLPYDVWEEANLWQLKHKGR